jgi:hypothetical protein
LSCDTISASADFLNFAFAFELLHHAGKKSPSSMLELHTVGDFADRSWLGECNEMREHLAAIDFRRARLARFDRVAARHQRIRLGHNRLTEIALGSKVRPRAA